MIPNLKRTPAIAVVLNDQDVLSLNPSELSGADLIELRIDLFENFESFRETFRLAKEKFNLPIIATLRSPSEGGKREIKDRVQIYREVSEFYDFIDVEIFSEDASQVSKLSKERGITLIGSYHSFERTLNKEELERVYAEGLRIGADIVKIATMVNSLDDLETLLLFTILHRKDKIVVIGMGEKGIPSRIINPVFGSMITYASINRQSAPGQLSLSDVVYILRCLGFR